MRLPSLTPVRGFRNRNESKVHSENNCSQAEVMPAGDCGCGGDDKCVGQCVTLPFASGPSCIGQCVALPRHWF
jgi:hypothetical protein